MTRAPIALDRRTFLRASGLTVGGLALANFLAACGGTASDDGQGTLTLRMPFLQDMQVPDPDIMYEGEGVQVMKSCYEGLVNYKSGHLRDHPRAGAVLDGVRGPADLHLQAGA